MRNTELLIIALVFSGFHLASPYAFKLEGHARRKVSSFSGGLAAAYVCLHLIPEIDTASHALGKRIFVIMMVGFAVYYGISILGSRQRDQSGSGRTDRVLNLVISGFYSFLLVYTLGEQLPDSAALSVAFAIMMGLHLFSGDFGQLELEEKSFTHVGRFVLATSVLSGYFFALMSDMHEGFVDVMTALLAGSMLFKVFHNELPKFQEAHYRAFLVGMGSFLLVHLALESA